nr:MAG TPA: hypothetical protein [Caudoviricetes sp.]
MFYIRIHKLPVSIYARRFSSMEYQILDPNTLKTVSIKIRYS